MKKYFVFLIFFAFFLNFKSVAQKQGQEKIDSLLIALKNYKSYCNFKCIEDSDKVNILINLAQELSSDNPDTALILSNKALLLSENISWQVGVGQSYHEIGRSYSIKGNSTLSLQHYSMAINVWNNILLRNDNQPAIIINKISSLGDIGVVYTKLGEYSKALNYHLAALNLGIKVAKSSDNNVNNSLKTIVATQLGSIGNIYDYQGNYSKAIDYDLKALKIFEDLGNKKKVGSILGNIGIIYQEQNNDSISLNYYFKALKIFEELHDKYRIGITYSNIGVICDMRKEYPKALKNYFEGLKTAEEVGDKNLIANILGNIGLTYANCSSFEILNSRRQINYVKALNYYFKSLEIYSELQNQDGVARNLGNVGSLFSIEKRYAKAEKYLLKARNLYDTIGALYEKMQIDTSLSGLYSRIGNYNKALQYYKKAMEAKDSLYNQEKDKQITQKEMTYEFQKQQDSTKAIQDKKDAITQQEIAKQKIIRNSVIGGSGAVALIGFLGFANFRNKRKKEKAELSQQVSATEMKALRSQMNPHFIFNALQSIQTFLLSHQSEEANTYLIKFSKLMRIVLENSLHSEVPIENDKEALELYVQLESIRLPHPFTYKFHIDENVDAENDTIPPLILQPFVENAIWHGLQHKTEPGCIDIYLDKKDTTLIVIIQDNGIGRNMSKQLEKPVSFKKESLGMKLTEERLKLLNETKKINAYFTITDLFTENNEPAGTRVELLLPLVYDQDPDSRKRKT